MAEKKTQVAKESVTEKTPNRIKTLYKEQVVPALIKKFNYTNVNQVPKLVKITINSGLGAVAILIGVFLDILELLVAFIQAYVFTMLSSVFIGLSRQEPAKE